MNSGAIEKLLDSIKEPEVETNRTNLAVVSRVDEEGIVWVNLAGADKETPTASTSAEVKSGDIVNVEWRNNKLYIAGNYTNPSAGITRVVYVERRVSDVNDVANDAVDKANTAVLQATEAKENASEAVIKANGSVASDTMHYLATSASSGVTINTQGWTTEVQIIDSQKRYLWTYHTYTKAGGAVVNTQPVITGTYGVDGTSVTILGSYDTLAELEAAHPTGQLGDAYMVAGDLYVWNGTAWEDVGQIQGPKGDTGVSIASVTNYYLATSASSGVTRETSGWTTAIQTMTPKNQYLWNYEIVKGTGNVTLNTTDPVIIGRYGQNGTNGISITAVQPQYYLSTSPSSPTGGTWDSVLVYEDGKYVWTREAITYSNNTTGYSNAIYNSALTSACVNALNALQIAEDTNQYFWHTETGTDTGAHITEIPKDDFIDDPDNGGGNLLARSNGIAVRNGLAELAVFGADGAQIGQSSGAHSVIDADGHRFYASNGVIQLANIGYGRIETSPGVFQTAPYYTLGTRSNQSAIGFYSFATGSNTMADGAYSFSEGRETKALSQGSHSEGVSTEARGGYESFIISHVAGVGTVSNGSGRYVIGAYNTDDLQVDTFTADGVNNLYQTTYSLPYLQWLGGYDLMVSVDGDYVSKYDDGYGVINGNKVYIRNVPSAGSIVKISYPKASHAFIIGNGTADNTRSNAFTVDWDGNVCLALDTTAASGTTDGDLYAAITALGWQSDVIV